MKRKINIPFRAQIAGILLLGVLASCAVLALYPRPQAVTHTVTFAYQDGTVIEEKTVTEGMGVYPPAYLGDGVFRGWSGRFNQVTADVEVHPIIHNIAEDNLFYFHAAYVKEGEDFDLEIRLGGNVSISSGTLTILYDPAVLEYLGADGMVAETAEGTLTLTLDSPEPIRQETLLATLQFRALEKDAYATEVQLQAKNMMIETGGQEIPADCATINNRIYFLQEVEP